MNRMWHLGIGQPTVVLLDRDGNARGTFDLDIPMPNAYANIGVMMSYGHKPERTTVVYGTGTERDQPHGYRFYAHLYYSMTEASGRGLCVTIINWLMADALNTVKFWPHRDATGNWHICKLDEDPDVDGLIEHRAIGYQLTLSLKSVRREYVLPEAASSFITNFNDVAFGYVGGDHVKNFGSVAAAYVLGDQPAYFSPVPSGGDPELPDYS